MIERHIDIATADGRMGTFICHPERHGPHPVILFFMDAPGIREELRDMARRLASVGYYVMLPNLYYRAGVEELGTFIGAGAEKVREGMFKLMDSLSMPMVMADADALIAYADTDPAASRGKIGTLGYCMSGRYALGAAVRHPQRVAAAASLYGTRLVTDEPDSPHRTLGGAEGRLYIGYAETDSYVPPETIPPLRQALSDSGVEAELELYPGVTHGFAFPQRPAYDKASAERHWERLFALYAATLAQPS